MCLSNFKSVIIIHDLNLFTWSVGSTKYTETRGPSNITYKLFLGMGRGWGGWLSQIFTIYGGGGVMKLFIITIGVGYWLVMYGLKEPSIGKSIELSVLHFVPK